MLGTNVGFVWPPHVQQCPTMPNNVGICWDKCWHRLARALSPISVLMEDTCIIHGGRVFGCFSVGMGVFLDCF